MKISKQNAGHYVWGDGCDGWYLHKGDETIIHERIPPETSEERHLHERAAQFFFILTGQVVMETDGVWHELGPQEGIRVPPGIPHCIHNSSHDGAEFLVISKPGTKGDRIPQEELNLTEI